MPATTLENLYRRQRELKNEMIRADLKVAETNKLLKERLEAKEKAENEKDRAEMQPRIDSAKADLDYANEQKDKLFTELTNVNADIAKILSA